MRFLAHTSVFTRQLVTLLLLSALSVSSLADDTQAKTATSIAVVNIAVLLDESPRAKVYGEEIKKQYLPQEQALAKERDELKKLEELLDKDSEKLSNDERIQKSRDYRQRKREYTRDYETFRDQLNSSRQKALTIARQEVLAAIDSVRQAKGIDIVIENFVSASKSVDITKAVIEFLGEEYKKEQNVESTQPPEQEK